MSRVRIGYRRPPIATEADPTAGTWMPSPLPRPIVATPSTTFTTGARIAMTGRSPSSRAERSSKGEMP